MEWQERYAEKRMSAKDAIERIPRGKNIFIGSGAAEPVKLVEELVAQSYHFADNTIVHIMTLGPAPYVKPEHEDRFRHNAFFIGPNVREAVHEGRADYTPIFLSQIPEMIRTRRVPVNVAFIQTSPPDSFGFVNLGVSVDIVLSAVEAASLVIAEINPEMRIRSTPGCSARTACPTCHASPSTKPRSRSGATSPPWWRTARRSSWASGRFPTPA
jgi:acyl-CoA hydrolase